MSDRDEPLEVEELSTDRPLNLPDELPILPLRDTVLFPNSFMPLAVARESSVRLIDEAISGGKLIGVFTQRDASVEEPQQGDLYAIGTASHIHKMFKLSANITDPGRLADFIASSITTISTPVKQEVLETLDVRTRLDALNRILIKE